MLPIAPSTYFLHHARQVDPPQRPARAKRDDDLRIAIQRVWDANWQAYGPRKVWQQLGREDVDVARCTGERLMGAMGLAGAVRGRAWVTTPDAATAGVASPGFGRPPVHPRRGPTSLWVSDFTYVATWKGFVYVAFVIDVFSRRIVGWRVSASLRTDFVLDALEQAVCERGADRVSGLVHHSDRGTQYLSMRYTDRLADAGIAPSVGSRGDSYDNALAESGDWAPQDGGDSTARSVAASGAGGIRDAGVGWIGSTTAGCSSPSATCGLRNSTRTTMSRLRWPDSPNSPSGIPGTIQKVD